LSDTKTATKPGTAPSAFDTIRQQKTILGHPGGLYVLFFTEMWERVSYYGMRALLILYMTDYLINRVHSGTTHVFGFMSLQRGLEAVFGPMAVQPLASQIYGIYTGLVYFTPFFGGMLADRVLGQRKCVVLGGVLMAIGQFLLAVESMFLLGLFVLILGNGCFKLNLATQVGSLYPQGDPRRDRAYTIYYMGVNLGAFIAPLVCGTLGQLYGWRYGFQAAGVGMVFGVIFYLWGQRFLAKDELTRTREAHLEQAPLTGKEWKAIGGLVVLMLLNIVFWAVYEQQGNTMQLFADRNTDWHLFGFQMPSTWFQAVNPMFIFTLTPLLNLFWTRQSRRGTEPASVTKLAMGCTMLGLSFLPLIFVTAGMRPDQRINFMWLVSCTLIYTLGELYLSPIGLSLVTKVTPARLVSMLMGMWYFSNFFGNYLTGYLGTYYEKMSKEAFFSMIALLAVVAGAAIFALQKPLKNAVGRNT
jgi:proton-dependent oligopeptide transporter, POT family